jgi:energy-coupling factor transport system permease protein
MFRGLFHYVDQPSYIHRLDPRVKLLLLIPIFLLMMTSNNPFTLLLIFSFVILLYVLSKIPFQRYKTLMIVCLFSSFSFIFFGSFFYFGFLNYPGRQVTIWLSIFRPEDAGSLPILGPIILWLTEGRGIVLTQEGFFWGLLTTLKFLITLFSGNLVIMTTKPKEILLSLNKFGVPIKLTFVAMTALRFVPLITEEWYITMNAQRARGLKFKRLDIKGTLTALTATLSTLVINSIRRARVLALAMETRAFGANEKKIAFKELKMTNLDVGLTVTICITTAVIVVLLVLHTYAGYSPLKGVLWF